MNDKQLSKYAGQGVATQTESWHVGRGIPYQTDKLSMEDSAWAAPDDRALTSQKHNPISIARNDSEFMEARSKHNSKGLLHTSNTLVT